MSATIVLLPDPDGPTIAVVLPLSNRALRPMRIWVSGLEGYENCTSLKTMSPESRAAVSRSPPEAILSESIISKKEAAALAALETIISGDAILPITLTAIMTEKNTLEQTCEY